MRFGSYTESGILMRFLKASAWQGEQGWGEVMALFLPGCICLLLAGSIKLASDNINL